MAVPQYPADSVRQYPVDVDIDGRRIRTRVLDAGGGDDLVVCIHGVGSRADRFGPLLEPLAAEGYRVLAVDLPGHGFASKGDIPFSVPVCASLVNEVVAGIPHRRLTVIGTSLGGQIGGCMPRSGSVKVDRLAMVGTLGVVPMDPAEGENISRVILRKRGVDDCRRKLEALIHDDARVSDSWAFEESQINNSAGADRSFDIIGRYFEGPINEDLIVDDVEKLVASGARVGMIWGSEDVIVSADTGRASMARLPELPMAWIEETGHAPYWERPSAFIRALEWIFADGSERISAEIAF